MLIQPARAAAAATATTTAAAATAAAAGATAKTYSGAAREDVQGDRGQASGVAHGRGKPVPRGDSTDVPAAQGCGRTECERGGVGEEAAATRTAASAAEQRGAHAKASGGP